MNRIRALSLLASACSLSVLGACSTVNTDPTNIPLYGNYENIDNQSLCLGMLAFASDFPQAVWPNQSKEFYLEKKEDFGIKSAALYKISLDKFGKQEAAERGMTGYSSAKTLAYVLGPKTVRQAVSRCQPVVDEALKVDKNYQNFLTKLSENPEKPAITEIVATPSLSKKPEITTNNASQPDKTVVIPIPPEVTQLKTETILPTITEPSLAVIHDEPRYSIILQKLAEQDRLAAEEEKLSKKSVKNKNTK